DKVSSLRQDGIQQFSDLLTSLGLFFVCNLRQDWKDTFLATGCITALVHNITYAGGICVTRLSLITYTMLYITDDDLIGANTRPLDSSRGNSPDG
ncbi:hypothetical protein, partial [Salmonella sp. s51884]|uniref:hypothetical protein n=1 Tax=Salmonella sp. s51884 TaxID=3159654 RepID=UPI00397EAB49